VFFLPEDCYTEEEECGFLLLELWRAAVPLAQKWRVERKPIRFWSFLQAPLKVAET
jgi:hypothetical protein